jgi:hypothetical protein
MTTPTLLDSSLIAPCGMNCGTCIGYLREKNRCNGCWSDTGSKPKSCNLCIVKNCDNLAVTKSKFCYDCESFPCKRIKQLDKRYRTKYKTSFIQNLLSIKDHGVTKFMDDQKLKWTCPDCGATLSCHRNQCLSCNFDYSQWIKT